MVVRDAARIGAALLLDVATVDGEAAHVTTQGTTAADQKEYDNLPVWQSSSRSVTSIKVEREAGFPKAVLELGFRVDIFHSEASVAIDRTRILNAICDVPADQLDAVIPQEGHRAFKAVNAALSGLFADAALALAAQAGEMESTVEVLRRDTARRRARVDIPCATIKSLAALAPAFRAWPALTELQLDATGSGNLSDVSALQSLAECPQLEVVNCSFSNCSKLADVDGLQCLLGCK